MKSPALRLGHLPLLLSFTLAFAAGTVRGETDNYAGSNYALIDAKKTLEAAAAVTLTAYPDCDEATVEEKIVESYRVDGTGGNQDEGFIKVLTEKGKRGRQRLAWGFQLPYDTVEVAKLELMKPSGEVVPVDITANSKVSIDSSQISANIYDPNSKVLEVNVPGLEIGDVIHWVVRDTIKRPIIPGEFSDENVLEGNGYLRHLVYEVHAPAAKPLKKMVLRDEVPGTVKYTTQPGENQTVVYRWEATNVPRMFQEPSMPPYENVLQRVLVSTLSDWHDVSKWYWNLSQPHLEATSPELKKKVAELTANAKTDPDKVKALFYYVSQKIRYMGLTPEKDRPGFEPHDACLTFDKKYGVCRDKAGLLVSMLRTAGLKAYPVLVDVGSKKDKEVPNAGFNHAIVCVELEKGKYVLMDPTDEHARDLLPWHDGNQSYLVCRPEGEDILVSEIQAPDQNLMRIKTTGVLSVAGGLVAKSELAFDGANDDIYRNAFSNMKADDIHRFFESRLKQALPGAALTSLKVTPENMLDVSTPIQVEMEYSVDGMTANGKGKSVVSVPWIGSYFGLVNFILGGLGLDERKYPLQTRVACGVAEDVSLKLGDGFAGADAMPVCTPVDDEELGYHRNFDVKEGMLTCSRGLKLKTVEFTPTQYATLKKTLKGIQQDARKSPVLATSDAAAQVADVAADPTAPITVPSNATILYSHKTLDVIDAHSSVYRVAYAKRILSYAGKKNEAEIKIEYDPACSEARLVRGVVTSKTGRREEISKSEINIMDADWSASAKRYTGGKILVANLPGVDIGSTIEVEYEITSKDQPFIGGFEPFQLDNDIQEKSFQLTAPKDIHIEQLTSAGLHGATVSIGDEGKQKFQWSTENAKALADEADLPPDWIYTPGVNYFVGDFKAYLKQLNDTMQSRSASRAKVEAVAHQVADQSKSKLETVQAIRDYVAKTIRVAGPSFSELPLSELSTADTTLADGYGHAADRAILLHAMLTAAGFQPEFVLASDLPPADGVKVPATAFPKPKTFDAPLVKLTLDGVTYYLNDTDQYAKLGSTQHDDRLGVNLATQDYEVIRAAGDCANKTETVYALSIADTGGVQMKITKHYFGGNYNEKARFFTELRPEERKRYFEELVSSVAQGAHAVGDLTTQFDAYPGTEEFTVNLDHYAVVDGKYLYFDLPYTPSLCSLPGGSQRNLPLMLSQDGTTNVRTEIVLPPGFQSLVIAPREQSLDAPSGGGKVRVTSSATAGKFILTDNAELSPAIINPQDYPVMLKVESTLEKKSAKLFLLEKE